MYSNSGKVSDVLCNRNQRWELYTGLNQFEKDFCLILLAVGDIKTP